MEKNKVQMYIYICTYFLARQGNMFNALKNNGATNCIF